MAFFPAFPIAGRLLARASGLREELALLVVANAFLAASFALFSVYLPAPEGPCQANLIGASSTCWRPRRASARPSD